MVMLVNLNSKLTSLGRELTKKANVKNNAIAFIMIRVKINHSHSVVDNLDKGG
jgi:hypothetical protein